ncbi:hypothetical protein CCACVL1_15795 [Corchorus capsularis]|uniref:Uncharacterized protein n=1 Tax=Corchorus capsularis TaxID=210143 RepID=A0A1R3I194_COCAP|nr:hypothetical protein CCACVL1_15795 [Corchorus capsularis]
MAGIDRKGGDELPKGSNLIGLSKAFNLAS